MKDKIIAILRDAPEPISGEEIGRRLQVSRVAVWKHIDQLKKSGVEIESTARGYRLMATPDIPFPWLFGERASLIHYHPELDSTMNQAKELARAGCPPYTVVITDRQTQGRGRLQRVWQSEKGGLYFSMVLRPSLTPKEAPLVNFAVALDLVLALEECCGIVARVKWPNDVLVDERKIAGILSQMEFEADQITFINIGVGVNLNNRPEEVDKPAVSALQLTGRSVDRVRVLSTFLDLFEKRMSAFSRQEVTLAWKARTVTLGRRVTVATVRDTYEGLAVDIDEDGGLILETADGVRQTIFYGDCFHS